MVGVDASPVSDEHVRLGRRACVASDELEMLHLLRAGRADNCLSSLQRGKRRMKLAEGQVVAAKACANPRAAGNRPLLAARRAAQGVRFPNAQRSPAPCTSDRARHTAHH